MHSDWCKQRLSTRQVNENNHYISNNTKKPTLDDFEIGRPLGSGKFGQVSSRRESKQAYRRSRYGQINIYHLSIMTKSALRKEEIEYRFRREI